MAQTLLVPIMILALGAVQSLVNVHLRAVDAFTFVEPPDERSQKWDPNLYKALSFGFLPPVEGALFQEIIDVAVIFNALRALRA